MVVPTYNERENIVTLVNEVKRAAIPCLSLLFVDDTSPDGTGDAIREVSSGESWVSLSVRPAKKGIGSAYQDGFREAISTANPDIVVEMDADLQHPPSAIERLVLAIQGGADVAVGSRYVPGGSVSGWSLQRRAASKGANAFARLLLGLNVADTTSGFRAYSRAAAQSLSEAKLPAKGFEFQVASLHLLKAKMKIVEVPYEFSARMSGKSKLRLADVVRFFIAVVKISVLGFQQTSYE